MGVRIERTAANDAQQSTAIVRSIYESAYVEAIASGDPFDSPTTFMDRFEHYVKCPGFDMAIAYLDDIPVGQIWGWPLPANASWWRGLLRVPSPGFTNETGSRTFALSEIMVVADYVGKGFAHQMHDYLLVNRAEKRATLLVEPDNWRARQAYRSWGWEVVSQLRPQWEDAPLFEVMVRSLPVT